MATQRRKAQEIGSVLGGAFTLLGLTGLIGTLNHTACHLSAFLEIPLRTAMGALSLVISVTWQLPMPFSFGNTRLLESLLQVTVCGWQLILAFACAA